MQHEPIGKLGLSPELLEIVEGLGIETIGELLDAEWGRFGAEAAAEIQRAALEAGLIAAEEPPPEVAEPRPVVVSAADAWSSIDAEAAKAENGELELRSPDLELDDGAWEAIGASERWRQLRSLSLLDMTYPEQKPWYELLVKSPPPGLEYFSTGAEFSGFYDIGPAAPAIAAVGASLQTLDLRARIDDLEPFAAPKLCAMHLKIARLPAGLLGRCTLPALATLELFVEEGDAAEILPLLLAPGLRRVDIRGFDLSIDWFDTLTSRAAPLDYLRIGCELGETFDDEAAIFEIMAGYRWLEGAEIHLPGEAQESAGDLLAKFAVVWEEYG